MLRSSLLMIPLLLQVGCLAASPVAVSDTLCRGKVAAAGDELVGAIVVEGTDAVKIAGANYFALHDATCDAIN